MPGIELNLGTVTVKDNAPGSGKLTQQHLFDWLDQQFDPTNAGASYNARLRRAYRLIGRHGVSTRAMAFTNQQARRAVSVIGDDPVAE